MNADRQQQEPARVLIAGGGVAGLEALLALRDLAGDRVVLTLLCPDEEFFYRPLAVEAPFAGRGAGRYPIAPAVRESGAEWAHDGLRSVDVAAQSVATVEGSSIPYDYLVLALGAQTQSDFADVTVFDAGRADEVLHGLVQDLEEGYVHHLAFVLPAGPTWPLPLYELALMAAGRAYSMDVGDIQIHFVTPEARPLAVFGDVANEHVSALLAKARIDVHTSANPSVRKGDVVVDHARPDREVLHVDRIVTLPHLEGRSVPGLPQEDGFAPIDEYCRVQGTENIYAAGDIASFPIKHGGLAAQQADVAAEQIAGAAGADVTSRPLRPVIRAKLLTGGKPSYLTAELIGSGGFRSTVSDEPTWDQGNKIAAPYLAAYLSRMGEDASPTRASR